MTGSDAPVQFRLESTTASKLWDYGWFDLNHFSVDCPGISSMTARDLLRSFVRDPLFCRSLATQPDPWGGRGDLGARDYHGPFVISRLPVDVFVPLPHSELCAAIDAIWRDPGFYKPPDPSQLVPVGAWLSAVERDGDEIHRLAAPDAAHLEFHRIWNVFHEFACVSRDRRRLTIAIIGYD